MKFIAKKHYTFAELEAHWNCTSGDLSQAVIDGELVPSLYIPPRAYVINLFTPHQEENGGWSCFPKEIAEQRIDKLGNAVCDWISGFYYLILPNRTDSRDCEFSFFASEPIGLDEGDTCYSLPQQVSLNDVLQHGVVMAAEVERVEVKSSDQPVPASSDKPLATIERNTLLTIIAALAKHAKIDVKECGKSAQYISGLTDELGANVSKRAIEEHLKKIPTALEVRIK